MMMKKRYFAAALALVLLAQLFAGCSSKTPSLKQVTEPSTEPAVTQPLDLEAVQEYLALEETIPSETSPLEPLPRIVERDGVTWRYNSRLRTVIFMGVDTRAGAEDKIGIGNNGRSDTLLLFVINPDTETIQLITISRDTITKVDVYDKDRNYLFSGNMQINMQYSFGDNAARSCQLVKKKISSLLYDLPIHYHCSMTMDGIVAAADLLGGIKLTLEEDWTDIDPSYTAGSTITMQGEQLERFLRYRDTGVSGSNNVRMARHAWFIRQMFAQLGKMGSTIVDLMMDKLSPYLETDMDADTLKQLATYKLSDEVLKLPGETVRGKAHDEYYIDEEACREMLLDVFYTPAD